MGLTVAAATVCKYSVCVEMVKRPEMMMMMMVMMMMMQEYLEYQRQMALQRMQEQEMEMRRRLEQQKQEQQMRAMQYTYPQVWQWPGDAYLPTVHLYTGMTMDRWHLPTWSTAGPRWLSGLLHWIGHSACWPDGLMALAGLDSNPGLEGSFSARSD